MRVIVVHEDGDKSSRVAELYDEVRECVKTGSMQYQGVMVEQKFEGALRIVVNEPLTKATQRKRHPNMRIEYDCRSYPSPCDGKCVTMAELPMEPAAPKYEIADNEVIVNVDKQGLTTDLKKFGVQPGALFLARREANGTIVLEPARIEGLT